MTTATRTRKPRTPAPVVLTPEQLAAQAAPVVLTPEQLAAQAARDARNDAYVAARASLLAFISKLLAT
jgi:hypothetical protein